jgi:hypothetical protein
MQTTLGAMRLVGVVVLVMAMGACGGDPLDVTATVSGDAGHPDAGGAPAPDAGAADAGAAQQPSIAGRWCAPNGHELDLSADGTYLHTWDGQPSSHGTWLATTKGQLVFFGPQGEAGSVLRIVSVSATTLVLTDDVVSTWSFDRCP